MASSTTRRGVAGAGRAAARKTVRRKTRRATSASSGSARSAGTKTRRILPALPRLPLNVGLGDALKLLGIGASILGVAVGYGKMQSDVATLKQQVNALYQVLVIGPAHPGPGK